MSRNASGVYTLPAGNPVISGTLIEAVWANTTMPDMAQALTDSLDRQGRGGMLAAFSFFDGTVTTPGITWTNEPTTGIYRAGSDDQRVTNLGRDIARFTRTNRLELWDNTGLVWQRVATEAFVNTNPTTAFPDKLYVGNNPAVLGAQVLAGIITVRGTTVGASSAQSTAVSFFSSDNLLQGQIGFLGDSTLYIQNVRTNGGGVSLLGQNFSAVQVGLASFDPNGGGFVNFAGALKFNTTAGGIQVTGTAKSTGAPAAIDDLTRKDYVDSAITGLSATYALLAFHNSSGISATLRNNSLTAVTTQTFGINVQATVAAQLGAVQVFSFDNKLTTIVQQFGGGGYLATQGDVTLYTSPAGGGANTRSLTGANGAGTALYFADAVKLATVVGGVDVFGSSATLAILSLRSSTTALLGRVQHSSGSLELVSDTASGAVRLYTANAAVQTITPLVVTSLTGQIAVDAANNGVAVNILTWDNTLFTFSRKAALPVNASPAAADAARTDYVDSRDFSGVLCNGATAVVTLPYGPRTMTCVRSGVGVYNYTLSAGVAPRNVQATVATATITVAPIACAIITGALTFTVRVYAGNSSAQDIDHYVAVI